MKVARAIVRKQAKPEEERLTKMAKADQPKGAWEDTGVWVRTGGVEPVRVCEIPQRKTDALPTSRWHFCGRCKNASLTPRAAASMDASGMGVPAPSVRPSAVFGTTPPRHPAKPAAHKIPAWGCQDDR